MTVTMRELLADAETATGPWDVALIGAPISKASISPSGAWATPEAFRKALARFPTWDASGPTDLGDLRVRDAGDVLGDREDGDATAAHQRIENAVATLSTSVPLVVVIGGDNSLTRPAFRGAAGDSMHQWGLLTVDAHHDCRPATSGSANGTPVRELIESGLAGTRVAQVGIHPLGNARDHALWARDQGVHIHSRDEVGLHGMAAVFGRALAELLAAGAERVYVDLDVDVVDRAFAPGCPASLPGGLSPADLLTAARLAGADPRVAVVDLCEVDATVDVAGITVRLMAAAFVAICAGVASSRLTGDRR